jgi:GntR family transcriptional regulator
MIIKIDTTSSTPIYAQIVDQIKRAVASGALRNGDPLPSLRETSVKLRVNPLTVDKAYKMLERDGLVETRHGLGTFVKADPEFVANGFRLDVLTKAVDDLLIDAHHLGITAEELKELLDKRSKLMGKGLITDSFEGGRDKDGR